MIKNLSHLLDSVKQFEKKVIAVVAAEDKDVLEVTNKAKEIGLADFILIGDKKKIEEISSSSNIPIDDYEIIDEANNSAAAEKAVQLVREGRADTLMKGLLQTGTFLKAVLNKEKGLNMGRLISQISVVEKPDTEGLLLITDCAMAIEPSLNEKKQIIENAVSLAHKLGYVEPKVALLSALEVVNPAIKDTMEAAILSKMSERGQIKGPAIVDGPFALDNAISVEAAEHKGVISPVAGRADIIVVPNIQVGNSLHKSLTFFAKKDAAAAVIGAEVPIIMTSRTDTVKNRLLTMVLSCYICCASSNKHNVCS